MRFCLFSKIEFEIAYPVALIECFCFQTNFYSSYDSLLPDRTVEDVGKIGARIALELLPSDEQLAELTKTAPLFSSNLDDFLKLSDIALRQHVMESSVVIKQLMARGIGFSQATKVLHTVYPNIFPMIDSMLQEEYQSLQVNSKWKSNNPEQILFDYYANLKTEPTSHNLAIIFEKVSKNLPCLTKVRVFDIVWWSYLKAKKLKDKNHINWCTIT
jgi:hypothetical protein